MAYPFSRLEVSIQAASGDGLYYGRFPHGDKPLLTSISGAAVSAVSAAAALATAIRLGGAAADTNSATAALTTALGTLTITNASPLPNATQQANYQGTVTLGATGGVAPYTFTLISQTGGNGWAVLQLSPGVTPYIINGTPNFAETDSLVIQCDDSAGHSVQKTFSLTVTPVTYSIVTSSPLPNAVISAAYTQPIVAQGGVPPYTYSITADSPDTGSWLSINSSTGILTGTPGTIETESLTVHVTDSSGGVNTPISKSFSLGVVAAGPPSFNFFISPTGDDNNAGTLASPWSITALRSKQSTYAGKVIGIIGDQGTIQSGKVGGVSTTLFSIYQGLPSVNAAVLQVLPINGGTSSAAPTYLASCDSTGAYSPRLAVIDCSNPSGGAVPTNPNGSIFGFNVNGSGANASCNVANQGNFTIDGLVMRNFTFAAICIRPVSTNIPGITITNCEISNATNVTSSGNPGAVWMFGANGMKLTNCKIHDLATTAGGGTVGLANLGFIQFNSLNTQVTNCTFYNCVAVSMKDDYQTWTVSYCYLGYGASGNGYSGAELSATVHNFLAGTGTTSTMHHNIIVGPVDSDGESAGSQNAGSTVLYNNTFCQLGSFTRGIAAQFMSRGNSGGTFSFYNNVVYSLQGKYQGNLAPSDEWGALYFDTASASWFTQFDHNYYGSNGNGMSFGYGHQAQGSTAGWKALGNDINSTFGGNPFSGTPAEGNTSSFAITGAATTAGIGGVACGALDGSGTIGCNF